MAWLAAFFTLCMLVYATMTMRAAWYFRRIPCEGQMPGPLPRVSVVIPARNEAEHLPRLMQALVQQEYPRELMEIILVDDDSEDATTAIGWLWAERHEHVHFVPSEPTNTVAYKKAALQTGIAQATGEIIVQTDADCNMGPNWLARMVAHFGPQTGLVSGPVLLSHDHTWLQRWQSLELIGLVALGAGSMAAGRPHLVNGANLAYRKAVFDQIGGYQGIDGVASGDDELLLQKIERLGEYEIHFVRCRDAIVETVAQPDWANFKAQRVRWVSKARSYLNRRTNLLQLLSFMAFLGLPLLLLMGFINLGYSGLALQLLILKVAADFPLMYFSARFFRKLPLLKKDYFPLQLAYFPYVIWMGWMGLFPRQYHWKGRKVK